MRFNWAKQNIFILVSGKFLVTVYLIQPEMKVIAVILGDKMPRKHHPE